MFVTSNHDIALVTSRQSANTVSQVLQRDNPRVAAMTKERIDDFEKHLWNKGHTKNHVATTAQRVRSVINECKFKRICDISLNPASPLAHFPFEFPD